MAASKLKAQAIGFGSGTKQTFSFSTYFTSTNGLEDVTGATLSVVVPYTRDIWITGMICHQNNTGQRISSFRILRDASVVWSGYMAQPHTATQHNVGFFAIDSAVAAGTYTYKLQIANYQAGDVIYIFDSTRLHVIQM